MLRNKIATFLEISIRYISWKNLVALRFFYPDLVPATLDT